MKKSATFFLVIFALVTAFAHEYILIAHEYTVKKGGPLELHLFVADGFNVELERPVQKSITKRFELISENGVTDLLAASTDGNLPVLETTVDFEGLGLVHMERDYARITLPNEAFKDYLQVDNIENIQIDDSTKTAQSERYSRYIKALIQSDPREGDTLFRTRVGHDFEIILLENPYLLHVGDWIKARVYFQGKPLPEKVITARNRTGNLAAAYQYARTDKDGICSFKLERSGDWFFHATHMIPCPDKQDADWESFWTSFSFGIPEE